jgi:hypothetical protein
LEDLDAKLQHAFKELSTKQDEVTNLVKLVQKKQRELLNASGLCAKLQKRKHLLLKSRPPTDRPPTDKEQTAEERLLAKKARNAAQMRQRRRRLREKVAAGDEEALRKLEKKREYDKD